MIYNIVGVKFVICNKRPYINSYEFDTELDLICLSEIRESFKVGRAIELTYCNNDGVLICENYEVDNIKPKITLEYRNSYINLIEIVLIKLE